MTDTTTQPRTCPFCTAPLPPRSAGAACPACLLSHALGAAPDDETLAWSADPTPTDREALRRPETLGGYRLLRLLGSGGMGRVYEAEHRTTGRRVALKRLGRRLDSPDMRQRFLREGRLAASVSHPNSLYVFGSEEIDGAPIITMEIAEGGTLQDELTRRGPFAVDAAVDAILDVVAGLEAAQEVGVLHRDVKPSNCFRTPEGTVKVGDYGLSISAFARDESYLTASGMILGTPAYAAPEQLRGDELDVRSDIYSVGATLHALLTGHPPFEGKNAVQVVAHAVKLEPPKLRSLRADVPHDLERIVARCLAKEPADRVGSYAALRDALLPFSSQRLEPASMKVRAAAGWIDFLIALLPAYVVLMLWTGGTEMHLRWLVERNLLAAHAYLACLGVGVLYFTLSEGLWGAGVGKRQKGLLVVDRAGRRPGLLRAFARIATALVAVEIVRVPILLATIHARSFEQLTGRDAVLYTVVTTVAPWAVAMASSSAREATGFATWWDRLSGTRVVHRPAGVERPTVEPLLRAVPRAPTAGDAVGPTMLGPYRLDGAIVADRWLAATDPLLHRPVWLLRRASSGPSDARRRVARPGRLRWLQSVDGPGGTWDAYEARPGRPLVDRVGEGRRIPWTDLRHWLHDLALELWAAEADGTLPPHLGLRDVWLTTSGRALLLDQPWPPGAGTDTDERRETVAVDDLPGVQRFLYTVARCAETTSLPLHARPIVANLGHGRFEKLSFLAGTLRGLLDRPAALGRGVRAGALFMLPTYTWTMVLVGSQENIEPLEALVAGAFGSFPFFAALSILACAAVVQLVVVPLRTTNGHALFRLAVVDATGHLASRLRLLGRWAVAWLPLIAALGLTMAAQGSLATPLARLVVALWLGAAVVAALDPHRGLHDRLAGTWVVRR